MNIEKQVCDLEQAKRLKELGIGESLYCWVYPVGVNMISTRKGVCERGWAKQVVDENEGDEFDHDFAPGFTVAELLVMLPASISFAKKLATLRLVKGDANEHYGHPESYLAGYYLSEKEPVKDWVMGHGRDMPAEALADLLIMVIEQGKTTVAEINERLKSA